MNNNVLIITLALTVTGCSGTPKSLDSHFGESVTHTLTEQTYNPAASHSNNPRAVTVFDGEKATGTLEGYRAMVPKEGTQNSNVIKLKIED